MPLPTDTAPVSFPLDADIVRRVESYARTAGTAPAEVIREAVEAYLAQHGEPGDREASDETVFDVLQRAGLIGCIPGTPGSPDDLSTNPLHMEGFGGE